MSDTPICQVGRAIDDLRRGYAVRLHDASGALWVRAAEQADAPGAQRIVLSAQRANYLRLGDAAVAVEVAPEARDELLYAAQLKTKVRATPAGALERIAVELVKLAGFLPAAAIAQSGAALPEVNAQDVAAYLARPVKLTLDTTVRLPIEAYENTRLAAFTEQGGLAHLALLLGAPEKESAPLVRLHSSCFTGDILGSLRCDCGHQLQDALAAMAAAGGGVLLYLNQEGRGIGLVNKLRAYRLQERGLDTLDANLALGFAEDERDFAVASNMLKMLGINTIRLLTNNPLKVDALAHEGIKVAERVPLIVAPGAHNKAYLNTKVERMGHAH